MLELNPELLIKEATHTHPVLGEVIEFKSITDKGYTNIDGHRSTTVEIVSNGKWGSALLKDLTPIS